MKLTIQKDFFGNPHPPRIFLCTTGKKRIGQLPTYDEKLNASWNKYSELSFSINRQYTDVITGETKVNPLFDKAEGLRKVYVENVGYFTIQDPDTTCSDGDTKTISAFSSEYECASKYLESFKINTGDVDSAEVMYLEDIYGEEYTIDTPYEVAPQGSGNFDAYEKYFVKEYTDGESYTYEQVEVADKDVYVTYDGSTAAKTLYRKKYPNVRFYWPTKPELSLLHLVFQKIPEWNIGSVDASLRNQERKFDEERIAVYDFLMNEVADTFKCIVEWDTINGVVNFYEEEENGITEENTIQERFDTNIYITRENLANEINIKYSSDDIKTKLKVSGSDDLDIREVNLGSNYLINLDYYHNSDWMENDLYNAYDEYKKNVKTYSPQYTEAVSGRVAAYNRWNELMNAVPIDGDVILVGDEFKKLYCIYGLYQHVKEYTTDNTPTYYIMNDDGSMDEADPQPTNENFSLGSYYVEGDYVTKKSELIRLLNLYHVDEDLNGTKTDNVLLTLNNLSSDSATIRIYDPKKSCADDSYDSNAQYYTRSETYNGSGTYTYTKSYDITGSNFEDEKSTLYTNDYKIKFILTYSSSGAGQTFTREISDWIDGNLRVTLANAYNGLADLEGFKVSSIGTMGAYFVLAKDESEPDNIDDYGVNLLQAKHNTYTKIFQTQTEAMYSQKKYQCIISDTTPEGTYDDGTRWLDSDSSPLKLYKYNNGSWSAISGNISAEEQANLENYKRYSDNYKKLQTVQQVLNRKEKEAQYYLEGYPVSSMRIDVNDYPPPSYYKGGVSLSGILRTAATKHFSDIADDHISTGECVEEIPLQPLTVSDYENYNFVVYLKDKIPYVAYASSVGAYQAKMNYFAQLTSFENAFTEDQWIRLSPLIREDEFSDSNFLLTGYESEEERLSTCQELMQEASKELKTLSQPSLEFSMNMANILALPEFSSLTSQFELGNFIRIELIPGLVKRARLLSVDIDFNDLSSFSCQFGNLVTTKDQIDLHADLMKQAIQAGKQVAASASDWQKAVDKSTKLEQAIANGLQEATLEVGKASGQSIQIGQQGIWGRKLKDGYTDEMDDIDKYEPQQFRIINNKLVFSNDAFQTSKALFGEYEIDGDKRWGVLAENVTGGLIEGSQILGGSLKIGDYNNPNGTYFLVDENGNVSIQKNGSTAYADADVVTAIENSRQYHTQITYSGSTVFNEPNQSTTLTCNVYSWDTNITTQILSTATFAWKRNSSNNAADIAWNNDSSHTKLGVNTITIKNSDINQNAQFYVDVTFDETIIT